MRVFQKKQVSNIMRKAANPLSTPKELGHVNRNRQTDRTKVLKKAFKLNLEGKRPVG
jgi:hypothetical protein